MPIFRQVKPENQNKNKNSPNARRRQMAIPKKIVVTTRSKNSRRNTRSLGRGMAEMVLAPAAVGHVVGVKQPVPKFDRSGNFVTITGQEVIVSLNTASQATNFELVGGHKFNPNFFVGSRLAYFANLFEQFKIDKLEICYITGSSSSTNGDVLLTYDNDPNSTSRDPTSATFVNTALSKQGAVLCSVWKDFCTTIMVDKEWKWNSLEEVSELRDSSAGDLFVYNRGTVTQPGYIMARYSISFRNPIYTPRPFAVYSWADWTVVSGTQAANPTVGNTVVVTFSGITAPNTVIAKAILVSATIGTGATTANAWVVSEAGINTAITLKPGDTFYIKFSSSLGAAFFSNLDQAKASPFNVTGTTVSNSISTGTAATTTSSFTFALSQIQLPSWTSVQAV